MSNLRFRIEFGMHRNAVRHIVADARGRFVVTSSYDKEIRVWDLDGQQPCILLNTGSRTAAISPDGELLALCFEQESPAVLCLVERRTGRLLRWLPSQIDFHRLSFSSDGRRLLLQGNHGVEVRDVESGRCLLAFDDDHSIYDADMDIAGRLVVVARDGLNLLLVDGNGNETMRTWAEETSRYQEARFTGDGRQIAVTCTDGRAEIRSARDLALRAEVHSEGAEVLAWSADGTTLYAGGDGAVHVISDQGRGARRSADVVGKVISLCPTAQGVIFGTEAPSWGLLAQDLRTRNVHTWPRARLSTDPASLRVSADGRCLAFRLASGEEHFFSAHPGQGLLAEQPAHVELLSPRTTAPWLKLFPASKKLRIRHEEDEEKERTEEYQLVAVAPDGSCCLTSNESSLQYYDAYRLECLWSVDCDESNLSVNISGDGRLIIAAHDDGSITWHAARDGKKLLTLLLHEEPKRWVAFIEGGFFDGPSEGAELIGWQVTRSQAIEHCHSVARNRWRELSAIGKSKQPPMIMHMGPAESQAQWLRDEHVRAHQFTYAAAAEQLGFRELHGTYLNPDYLPASLLKQHVHRPEQVYAALDAPLPAKALWMGQRAKLSEDPAHLCINQDGRCIAFRLASGEQRYFSMQPNGGLLSARPEGVELAQPLTTAPWLTLLVTDDGQRAVIQDKEDCENEYKFDQVAVSPDGAYCLLSKGREVRYIEAHTDNMERCPDHPARNLAVNISGDGQLVVSALADGSLVWRAACDGEHVLTLVLHEDGQRWAAFTEEGEYVGALPQPRSYCPEVAFAALDVPLAAKKLWTTQRARFSDKPADLLVSDDGHTIAFRLASGEQRCFCVAPEGGLSDRMPADCALSPPCIEAPWVQVFEDAKTLRLRQPDDDQRERDEDFDAFAVSKDGAHCVLCSEKNLRYFTASPLDYSNSISDDNRSLAINLSGDGRLIVALQSDGTIRWLSTANLEPLLTLLLHEDGQQWALCMPNGQFAATPPLSRGRRPEVVYAALRGDTKPEKEAEPLDLSPLLPPLIWLLDARLAPADTVSRVRIAVRTRRPISQLRLNAGSGPGLVIHGAALDATFIPSPNPGEELHDLSFHRSEVGEGTLKITAETEHAVSAPLLIESAAE